MGETSLHVLVSQLRSTLGDDPRQPRFVRTVAGFGYAFLAPAEQVGTPEVGSGRRLGLETEASSLALGEGVNVLGRDEQLATRVDGPGVSRRHARILISDGRATLEDLGSKNGTFLNGDRVASPRPLQDGATIRLGRRTSLVFRSDASDPTETEASGG